MPKKNNPKIFITLIVCSFIWLINFVRPDHTSGQELPKPLDPKAWGSNHAGQAPPDYVSGEECLFCHRKTTGPQWQKNGHGAAMRMVDGLPQEVYDLLKQPALAASAKDIEYVLGSRHHLRFLKKNGYGKLDLLNAQVEIDANAKPINWINQDKATWDKEKFANNCAGCHTTAVNPKTKSFSTFGLDCYTCHGNVNLEHTNDTKLMLLSKKRRNEPQIITSICAQCHLREGKSKSTGLPYPNNFIAGDNLFQDYEIDWAKADDEKLNPIERHIYRNVRDVAVNGQNSPTCITCHQVHYETKAQSLAKHKLPPRAPICFDCHLNESPLKAVKPYTRTNRVCEY